MSSQPEPEFCPVLSTPPTNRDHIPASQFFASSIRQKYNLSKLLTAEVHKHCKSDYKSDEESLVYTLLGFMRGSEAGNELYKYILARYRRGKAIGLVKKSIG
jgi:hypothetical protein